MSYLFTDLDDKDRIESLENEILRLQGMCRKQFALVDQLKKENKKLAEVNQEIKDTTGDLGYSMAECPWYNDDVHTLTKGINILISYTQKVQYILGLPIFINPREQLQKGNYNTSQINNIISKASRPPPRKLTRVNLIKCKSCPRSYRTIAKYKVHYSKIHKMQKKYKFKCKSCHAMQESYLKLKYHYEDVHGKEASFSSHQGSYENVELAAANSSYNYVTKNQQKKWHHKRNKCQNCERLHKILLFTKQKESETIFKTVAPTPTTMDSSTSPPVNLSQNGLVLAKKLTKLHSDVGGELHLHSNGIFNGKSQRTIKKKEILS